MAKRTKTQYKRLISDIEMKSRVLFMNSLISTKDYETIQKMCGRAYNKLK